MSQSLNTDGTTAAKRLRSASKRLAELQETIAPFVGKKKLTRSPKPLRWTSDEATSEVLSSVDDLPKVTFDA